ncbi:Translation initiation factor 5B (eIF-5B) [Pseudoloma neurophilia]|uniref:Eukaryotic translation initiation factor 5B n=1 Tax=Pseudoloma neurophilia TaxID=146866 RepID=A0A0R0LWR2_9MICR|nr:Translation initiation factor 5B (eIF-5B) [Pseudoloma neurophilia]
MAQLNLSNRQKEAKNQVTEKLQPSAAKNDQKVLVQQKRTFRISKKKSTDNDQEEIQKEPVKEKEEFFYKAPIVCILGHVDTGKTKILDKLRQSNVQGNEAGGITQQIGATFFPYAELMKKTKTKFDMSNDVPGLLVIDTPGHETFSNLRSRGSSMCNFAILVVDILHALEKQTLESIELLKMKKTPFLIALNKIDRIFQWKSENEGFSHFDLEKQSISAQREFTRRIDDIVLKFSEIGLNVRFFRDNPDEKKFINIIPTSAITGEGLSDLVNKIIELSAKYMKNKITFKDRLEATVLEVKNVEGIGMTVDAIVSNGHLNENDKIVICGSEGPITTHVKSLLVPEPLKELRIKSTYKHLKTVKASLGIKIAAAELEKAIAGSQILKVSDFECEEEAIKQVMMDIKNLIELDKVGIHLQASSLGSLEALIALVKAENIKIASIGIGKNITRKDILKMKAIKKKDPIVGIMLCFDTKIEKEMLEIAENHHIKVFEAQIIYNLIDKYLEYTKQIVENNKKKTQSELIYPCKAQIIPQFIFTRRSPLVLGLEILEGKLKINMPLYYHDSGNNLQVGKVTSIINEKKSVEIANKGDKVSVKIETADTPRLIGRDISEEGILYSTLSRKSIDILKEFYKDEITDDGWRLVMKIKQHLGII